MGGGETRQMDKQAKYYLTVTYNVNVHKMIHRLQSVYLYFQKSAQNKVMDKI